MNQLSLNLVAIAVFLMTLTTLLGPLLHISPAIPAIAIFGMMAIGTLDAFSFQGQGQNVLLDWIAGFSPAHRERIIRHEAGHFLVAQQLGIPVTDYSLTAWEALRKGFAGQGGIQFDTQELDQQLQQGKLSAQWLDRFCTVWMAGIAAEKWQYGNAEGGSDDRLKLRAVLNHLKFSDAEAEQKERLCVLRAKTLLEENSAAYDALVEALTRRDSVADCQAALAAHLTYDNQPSGLITSGLN